MMDLGWMEVCGEAGKALPLSTHPGPVKWEPKEQATLMWVWQEGSTRQTIMVDLRPGCGLCGHKNRGCLRLALRVQLAAS